MPCSCSERSLSGSEAPLRVFLSYGFVCCFIPFPDLELFPAAFLEGLLVVIWEGCVLAGIAIFFTATGGYESDWSDLSVSFCLFLFLSKMT